MHSAFGYKTHKFHTIQNILAHICVHYTRIRMYTQTNGDDERRRRRDKSAYKRKYRVPNLRNARNIPTHARGDNKTHTNHSPGVYPFFVRAPLGSVSAFLLTVCTFLSVGIYVKERARSAQHAYARVHNKTSRNTACVRRSTVVATTAPPKPQHVYDTAPHFICWTTHTFCTVHTQNTPSSRVEQRRTQRRRRQS